MERSGMVPCSYTTNENMKITKEVEIDSSEAQKLKEQIMEIDDPKLLNYVRELIYARESLGRADASIDPPEETKYHDEAGEEKCVSCNPMMFGTPTPAKKFKPVAIKYESHEDI